MANIKKAFIDLHSFLVVNKDKKIKTVLTEVEAMCSAKSAGGVATASHKNEAGEITHVRCGYYKQWMPLSHVAFGEKASSATGLNSYCKEGMSHFTKQQALFKKGKEAVLTRMLSDEANENYLSTSDAKVELDALETARTLVTPRVDGIGWDTIEEAVAVSSEELDAMVAAVTPDEDNSEE